MTKKKEAAIVEQGNDDDDDDIEEVELNSSSSIMVNRKSSALFSSDDSSSDQHQQLYQLASISEVFSYGDKWVKAICLPFGFFFAVIEGILPIAMIFYFSEAFSDLVADPSSPEFMKQVRELAYTFLVLGVMALFSLCVYATLLETSAGNMTKDFKKKWFRALLRQDMAYFDIQDVSGTATLISTNGSKYKRYERTTTS
jgi:ABC-type multidrug transport system fused ATPase/permease subunit